MLCVCVCVCVCVCARARVCVCRGYDLFIVIYILVCCMLVTKVMTAIKWLSVVWLLQTKQMYPCVNVCRRVCV